MPITTYSLSPDNEVITGLGEDDIQVALAADTGVIWLDLSGVTREDGDLLSRRFGFHPLTIDDTIDTRIHIAKVEDFDDHLFLILHGIDYAAEEDVLQTVELNVFIGHNYLVTAHSEPIYSVDHITRIIGDNPRLLGRGPANLAHTIISSLVDNIGPTLDRLAERVDDIEAAALKDPHPTVLEALIALKRSSLRLRRAMAPQREVLNRLGRHEISVIDEAARPFYWDIHNTMLRLEGSNDNIRERIETALTTYLSAVANRQNEVMKLLSMVAAIFLPLSLVAGIYGMNFENMPELGWSWGYFVVLGFMASVIAGMSWWFWVRRWISVGRRLKRFTPTAVDPSVLAATVRRASRRSMLSRSRDVTQKDRRSD